MHKTMIGPAAGLALLVSALLSWDANAITLTGFGTLSSLGARLFRPWLARAEDGYIGGAKRYQHVFHV